MIGSIDSESTARQVGNSTFLDNRFGILLSQIWAVNIGFIPGQLYNVFSILLESVRAASGLPEWINR
jgi:hypothetical protein